MTTAHNLPRLTSRAKRAWSLLRRAKPFFLVHQGETYYVDSGGWAKPVGKTGVVAVRASTLLDPAKKPVR